MILRVVEDANPYELRRKNIASAGNAYLAVPQKLRINLRRNSFWLAPENKENPVLSFENTGLIISGGLFKVAAD